MAFVKALMKKYSKTFWDGSLLQHTVYGPQGQVAYTRGLQASCSQGWHPRSDSVWPDWWPVLALRACREKLFNYFDIEPKYISLTEDCFVATPEKIAAACDKNTIGVVAILGTTYSGHFEDVEGIDDAVSEPPHPRKTTYLSLPKYTQSVSPPLHSCLHFCWLSSCTLSS